MPTVKQTKNDFKSTGQGFTIVELLIVIVVIGILAAITIVAFNGVQQRARIAVLQSDMKNAATQLEQDNQQNGAYPSSTATANSGSGLKASPGTAYQYTYTSTGNSYCLTGTNSGASYYVSSANPGPRVGACPGHTGVMVTTLAGSTAGYADGTGANAQFDDPYGIAVDTSGTLFIADRDNHRIRKVTPTGTVTTLAGSTQGLAEGIGASAKFDFPYRIAVDNAGNAYVADYANNRVRKITPTGTVSTLAGSTPGYANGAGSAAQFYNPFGVAVDNSTGVVYVADYANYRIRKVTMAGLATTFAGSTPGFADGTGASALFDHPRDIAIGADGTTYVADFDNCRIRKITTAAVVTTLAGSTCGYAEGTGTNALFDHPQGLAVDSSGVVYVADSYNNRIRKITPAGVVTTFAGTGEAGYADGTPAAAKFDFPQGVAVDGSGAVYVTDRSNHRIRKIQ